jgi:hypothetical protein
LFTFGVAVSTFGFVVYVSVVILEVLPPLLPSLVAFFAKAILLLPLFCTVRIAALVKSESITAVINIILNVLPTHLDGIVT